MQPTRLHGLVGDGRQEAGHARQHGAAQRRRRARHSLQRVERAGAQLPLRVRRVPGLVARGGQWHWLISRMNKLPAQPDGYSRQWLAWARGGPRGVTYIDTTPQHRRGQTPPAL
jgi:hypothetical protein